MKKQNRIILIIASICIAALMTVLIFSIATPQAEAQKSLGCNIANVAGSYAYVGFGTVHPGNPVGFPDGIYNTTARLIMDGAGNYTVVAKTSYNGLIVDEEFAGTYTVGDACDVTFYYGGFPAVFSHFTNNRSEARAMSTIPRTNITMLTVRK
jgi:ABC-type antimicrobial peptide transport system permease subunit